ncbi:hypothetical protein Tco_0131612 [Tanacetum coccineum]
MRSGRLLKQCSYIAMTAEITNGSVKGIKASHGILRDGVCRRSLLFSVTLSDRVDSILQMWLAGSLGALTMFSTRVCVVPLVVVKPADYLSSFLLPPGSGRGLLQEFETRSVMRMSVGILVKVLMRLFLAGILVKMLHVVVVAVPFGGFVFTSPFGIQILSFDEFSYQL